MCKSSIALSSSKKEVQYILLLMCIFFISEIVINPLGNFPLNDEWLYAKRAFDFSETHVLNTSEWGRTTMLAHIFYGSVAILMFGFSYTVLHLSTLLFSVLGIICFYYLMNDFLLKNSFYSFLTSLIFLINPLYISLSNSFMTDISFISTSIAGLYFYLKFKNSTKYKYILICLLFFVWSILVRQLALSFVLGIVITECLLNWKKMLPSVFVLFGTILTLFIFELWLGKATGYSALFFNSKYTSDSSSVLEISINFLKRWVHYISFSGFVLFPLLIPKLYLFIKDKDYLTKKKIMLFSFLLFIPVLYSMQKFPIGNYLYNTGVGSETLVDTYIYNLNTQHSFSYIFYLIKFISYLGSFSLLLVLVEYSSKLLENRHNLEVSNFTILTLLVSLLIYYSLLAVASPIFDRYINVFTLLIIPLIIYSNKKIYSNLYAFTFLASVLLLFSVFACKDYFSGHTNRWAAINKIKEKYKITDTKINGGLEHEATVFYNQSDWFLRWQNIPENDYVIAYGNLLHYSKFDCFYFQRYIPYKIDTIFILKHNNAQ